MGADSRIAVWVGTDVAVAASEMAVGDGMAGAIDGATVGCGATVLTRVGVVSSGVLVAVAVRVTTTRFSGNSGPNFASNVGERPGHESLVAQAQ